MKVLFAVNDENISEAIVKEYQKQYKEIISYKNVYYFNAIIKELQKDKSYDRIVISEDLEPFANNNYDTIDKFIFEKLDSISDEAIDDTGKDTQIILITSDRRNFRDGMLLKFFGIGVYSALIGKDKSIEKVCELIKRPRTKKEAKQYYKIDSDEVRYQSESENDVSESEIKSILAHYKKLGKNTEKYVDSFNNIASQYTDAQLKIIINFLPVGVKAVLESESPKYQELAIRKTKNVKQNKLDTITSGAARPRTKKDVKVPSDSDLDEIKIDMLKNRINTSKMSKPVVIPSEMETQVIKKVPIQPKKTKDLSNIKMKPIDIDDSHTERVSRSIKEVSKKEENIEVPKRGRGRPRKEKKEFETVNLYDLEQEDEYDKPASVDSVNLFGLNAQKDESVNLFGIGQRENNEQNNVKIMNNIRQSIPEDYNNSIIQQRKPENIDLSSLITRDKKIVSFVGTTKNGTSFIVNNMAELFSSMGISTAILDMTQSRNAYYIYTQNDENLRKVADNCINNLRSNIPEGIKVNKNLTVYSAVPGSNQNIEDAENILTTLLQNYSLILIDCDFETPVEYFQSSQEIYLVQSMDVLTIQPLTAFLRDLKNKDILDSEKIKIIINKEQRVSGLSPKVLIGGMAYYNDPTMSYMTELFDRTKVQYTTIPFEVQNYSSYLESLVNCSISLKGYTKLLNTKLNELANMIYPLIGQRYSDRRVYR